MAIDTDTLATTLVSSFLIPYVKLGLDNIYKEVTEQENSTVALEAIAIMKKVWDRIKGIFSGDDAKRLEFFEAKQGENKDLIVAILKEKLQNDIQLADEFIELITFPTSALANSSAQIMMAHIAGIVDARGANFSNSGNIVITGVSVSQSNAANLPVLFSSYTPQVVHSSRRYSLLLYAYTENYEEAAQIDLQRFQEQLGGVIPAPRQAKQASRIKEGTIISVIPECDELEFEPENLNKKWHGDWTRFEFEFRPSKDLADQPLFVRISIQVAGIEIAHIKTAIDVIEVEAEILDRPVLDSNPILNSKMKSQTVTPYQSIFISYSRRDSNIAKSYKVAQTALGNDAFLDVDNLRAGEDWRTGLARAIDKADIFQLFWSEHSASSEYCRYEWDYALKVRCPENNCEGFIRPIYWRKPMPSPPPELSRINFRFVPFEDQDD